MRKKMLVFALMLGLVLGMNSAAKAFDSYVQSAVELPSKWGTLIISGIDIGNQQVATAQIINPDGSLKDEAIIGTGFYLNKIDFPDDSQVVLIGMNGNWDRSVIITLDVENLNNHSRVVCGKDDYIQDVWTTWEGVFYTSYQYKKSGSVMTVGFWEYNSKKPTRLGQWKDETTLVFGYNEANDGLAPGIMSVSGTTATIRTLTETALGKVIKQSTVPKNGEQFWFWINGSGNVSEGGYYTPSVLK